MATSATAENCFYRLRSADQLLSGYHELAKQEIYFAKPEELNDPMEGYSHIVWQGDAIVWTNLFRHYIHCLSVNYAKVADDDESDFVPGPIAGLVPSSRDDDPLSRVADEACKETFNRTRLRDLIDTLATSQYAVRREGITLYLRCIHLTALNEVANAFERYSAVKQGRPAAPWLWFPDRGLLETVISTFTSVTDSSFSDSAKAALCSWQSAFESLAARPLEQSRLRTKHVARTGGRVHKQSGIEFLFVDFPQYYISEIVGLVYPEWYVACFLMDFKNSSVWAHYGDHHRGACLVFDGGEDPDNLHLRLTAPDISPPRMDPPLAGFEAVGSSLDSLAEKMAETSRRLGATDFTVNSLTPKYQAFPFHPVTYGLGFGELNFFRSILVTPLAEKLETWYTDREGNRSAYGAHLRTSGPDSLPREYWERFYRDVTIKTQDWAYEKEARLLLSSVVFNLGEAERRKLKYEFSALKGIIFGLNMSDEDKMRIIDIIKGKCRESRRTDFQFYQAYYDHDHESIGRYLLEVDLGP